MSNQSTSNLPNTDDLIEAIQRKLLANRLVLEKSLPHGRLTWRIDRKSKQIEVVLEPQL